MIHSMRDEELLDLLESCMREITSCEEDGDIWLTGSSAQGAKETKSEIRSEILKRIKTPKENP